MAYLDERKTIEYLLSLDCTKLKNMAQQKLVTKDQDDILTVQFDIIYDPDNNISGYITIRYNFDTNSYKDITLNIEFARPAGAYNYPDLHKLAPKFMKLLRI